VPNQTTAASRSTSSRVASANSTKRSNRQPASTSRHSSAHHASRVSQAWAPGAAGTASRSSPPIPPVEADGSTFGPWEAPLMVRQASGLLLFFVHCSHTSQTETHQNHCVYQVHMQNLLQHTCVITEDRFTLIVIVSKYHNR
jgi:hypothetical protein